MSPVLLNIALHGMERMLGQKFGVVRYADDFIVCARTREEIERIMPKVKCWLQIRGLTLHPEKTRIVHINEGFNFLGFNVRRYRGHCLIKPQKEKVLDFLKRLGQWLRNHYQATPEEVIRYLNPILRGWSYYYKTVVSKETFSYVSHRLWQMLWRWSLRRHPNKGKHWVYRKYFQAESNRHWHFHGDCSNPNGKRSRVFLFDINSVAIQRHVKVRGAASPDDPLLFDYWRERISKHPALQRCGYN
ncbi:MAG: group II intron maturase-specific domain-containing protein [Nitrospira sp.]|nr:group II intron maturase-specific domain-containing protein [Nitrospira sp.]